jgi:S-locus glycoprotein domain/D-mannose binding lectin
LTKRENSSRRYNMMKTLITSSKQQRRAAVVFSYCICFIVATTLAADPVTKEIQRGFSAKHDESYSQFQQLIADPTGVFSLVFLRTDSNLLDLAVLHLPSSFPLWRAIPANPAPWTGSVSLSFNGTLVLSDQKKGTVFWSAPSAGTVGDRVLLLNSSNLQILKTITPASVLWQSFDFPSNTIVENQNFTSYAKLLSTNQQFSMLLGANYFGLNIEDGEGRNSPIYFKHTALEAKAQIVENRGPIYARISSDGFLGMYQKEGPPVDVLSFDTFNRKYDVFYRMTLEDDGNLKAYYWNKNNTAWSPDYTAITEPCNLPSTCGSYSICRPQEQPQCMCLANSSNGCLRGGNGDFCGASGANANGVKYEVLRRQGMELANKDFLNFTKKASLEECHDTCEKNCNCWGAIYSNTTGNCYMIDYPIQMLVEGDDNKFGYFKLTSGEDGNGDEKGSKEDKLRVALVLLVIVCVILVGSGGYGAYLIWERRRGRRGGIGGSMEDVLAPGPYKDLASASFKSIELSDSFRKS